MTSLPKSLPALGLNLFPSLFLWHDLDHARDLDHGLGLYPYPALCLYLVLYPVLSLYPVGLSLWGPQCLRQV